MEVKRINEASDELYHYGVKGMKWHHHKYVTKTVKKKKPRVSKEYQEELEYNSRHNVYPEQYEEDEDRTTYDGRGYKLTDEHGRSIMSKNGTPSDIRIKYADMEYFRKRNKKRKRKNMMKSEIYAEAGRAATNKYQDISIKRAKPISQEDWSALQKRVEKIKAKYGYED